jgi:hypothetical protein
MALNATIERHGVTATPTVKTLGTADDYGDEAVTWTDGVDERVILYQPRGGKRRTPAGEHYEPVWKCYLRNDSLVTVGAVLTIDSVKYEVTAIEPIYLFADLMGYRCDVRREQ